MLAWFPHFAFTLLASFLPPVWSQVPTYFKINIPTTNTVWLDGSTSSIQWTVAREDVSAFDVQLVRLGTSGLKHVAHNVPISLGSLNVNIQGLPIADDYYIIFLNTSVGITYSLSDKFAITSSSSAANGQSVSNKPTASVAGAPSPTETWGLEFDAKGSVIGSAMGRSTFVSLWWIGVLAFVGAVLAQ